ncbi:hypothetical protein [Sphingomonas oryzagri]
MVTTITRELKRAWPYLLVGNCDRVIEILGEVDHPSRAVAGLANSIRAYHPGREAGWLHTANIRLGGTTPGRWLRIDDSSTWEDVSALLLDQDTLRHQLRYFDGLGASGQCPENEHNG